MRQLQTTINWTGNGDNQREMEDEDAFQMDTE